MIVVKDGPGLFFTPPVYRAQVFPESRQDERTIFFSPLPPLYVRRLIIFELSPPFQPPPLSFSSSIIILWIFSPPPRAPPSPFWVV